MDRMTEELEDIVRSAKAWALWNECQGVFTCSVTHTRSEAETILAQQSPDSGCKVVPVRVIVETSANHRDRHDEETEWKQHRYGNGGDHG